MRTNNPNNIVFLDIETPGLSVSQGAKICEVAMLKIKDGEEFLFNSLIHPQIQIPEACSLIHGITDDMVKNSPKIYEVAKEIAEIIAVFTLVCHNESFDLNFYSFCSKLLYLKSFISLIAFPKPVNTDLAIMLCPIFNS